MLLDDDVMLDSDGDGLLEDEAVQLDTDYGDFIEDDEGRSAARGEKLKPGDSERQAQAEASEILEGFKQRAKNEEQRMYEATDSEYWIAVCFQIREQKEEFLRRLKLIHLGDKYLDGMLVAEALGIELTTPVPPIRNIKFDRGYTEFAMTPEELDAAE